MKINLERKSKLEKKEIAKNFRRQTTPHEKWLKMWDEFEEQIEQLPAWKRKIMIDDLGAAFRSRMTVMLKTENANPRKVCKNKSTFALQKSA